MSTVLLPTQSTSQEVASLKRGRPRRISSNVGETPIAHLKLNQYEKVLTELLSGDVVPLDSLEKSLGKEIYTYRMSVYLWELKKAGAHIMRLKTGRKITALKLRNVRGMRKILRKKITI
jgi:hypothetical protein